ncbi:hypothetical protein THAOC_16239 [Thalassiosira oceanica]|uniref:Uncharacterized protein n=1 Tax=Thalassiosira oceanica TaxID=159749 RepID=K0SCN5_THAOC|nr:hypothetical protein THAOC_16239 [Thalassiosira oceanica]|eukprot:EJK63120.1 hypothetical protein THAOC_16239 [Thalassiosira oceanica]
MDPRSVSPHSPLAAEEKMIDRAPSIPKLISPTLPNEIRTNSPMRGFAHRRVSLMPRKQHHPSPTDPPRPNQRMPTSRMTEVDEFLSGMDNNNDTANPIGTTPTGVDTPFESLGLPNFPSLDLDDQAFSRSTSPALPRTPRPPSFAIRPRPSRAQQPCDVRM